MLFLGDLEIIREKKNKKVIYYSDELNDDFAENNKNINTIKIDGKYKYIHKNPIWNIMSFIVYRIIFMPPIYFYLKLRYGLEVKNREVIKKYIKENKRGFFIYHNHTQEIVDTFLPTRVGFHRKVYLIANPDNVSIKGMKTLNKLLGALPVPGDKESTKNFIEAIEHYINKGRVISIYPEAHIWPFYTKIRNFGSVSFKYPCKLDCAVFSSTTTYQKVGKNKVKMVLYVDGPFYPDKDVSIKEAQNKLRDEVYNKMVERAQNSNVEIIKYMEGKKENG